MLFADSLDKVYYCPLRNNCQIDDSGGEAPYPLVDALSWQDDERARGKAIKIKGFSNAYKVKLFRVAVSTQRTDRIVTNDLPQDSLHATQEVCGMCWKIEQFHREIKQLTGLEQNQCRKASIQRNHITREGTRRIGCKKARLSLRKCKSDHGHKCTRTRTRTRPRPFDHAADCLEVMSANYGKQNHCKPVRSPLLRREAVKQACAASRDQRLLPASA